MRTLILFRHAKSAWDDPDTLDFDRPLAERGITAAPVMAQWLKNTGLGPDFDICSRALRARATLELGQPVQFGDGTLTLVASATPPSDAGAIALKHYRIDLRWQPD